MQKAADAADISVLFFSAGANFWAILGHFWAILGNFRSFLGHFLVLIFVAKYASVLFKSLFATLCSAFQSKAKQYLKFCHICPLSP